MNSTRKKAIKVAAFLADNLPTYVLKDHIKFRNHRWTLTSLIAKALDPKFRLTKREKGLLSLEEAIFKEIDIVTARTDCARPR